MAKRSLLSERPTYYIMLPLLLRYAAVSLQILFVCIDCVVFIAQT